MPNGLRVKSYFFDRKSVIDALDRAKLRALSKIGAFIRTRSRTSMRKRKGVSAPGQTPSVHEGSLKRLIFFSYDPSARSVVIGPEKFRDGKAPALLEFGGTRAVTRKGQQKTAKYTPRPYMAPALAAEEKAGTLSSAWAASVRSK